MQLLRLKSAPWLALAVLLLTLLSSSARASPNEDLQSARDTFLAGRYEAAIGQFGALLYPSSRLAKASAIAEAHLLLGVSYFETGNHESAGREFEEALFLDDGLSLESNLFSAEAIRFFDQRKAELKQRAADALEKERLARKQQALSDVFQNILILEKRRYWVNFIPFGAGQFQNGQRRKGVAFFVGEALTGATTVGLWGYQVIKYGYRGKVPRDEVDTVNSLQILQIGSGAAFYALLAYGIVDSLSHYEHAVKREVDPAALEKLKDLEDLFENEPTTSLRLIPNIGPESTGVSLLWEF